MSIFAVSKRFPDQRLQSAPVAARAVGFTLDYMAILVGTSGFVYSEWRGLFYPAHLAQKSWLDFYAGYFSTVEINNTFYRLPAPSAVDRWRADTPADFLFACKGSRYLTHMKRLNDTTTGLDRFFAPILRLGPKLGPVLFQLPPQMSRPDPERLATFLKALPPGPRYVFEFRSAAWYCDEILAVLDEQGVAVCEHDLLDVRPPRATGGFRYLRFHGRSGHQGHYGLRRLAPVARSLAASHCDAFVYFNNDGRGNAVADAFDLERLLRIDRKTFPLGRPPLLAGS